MRKLSQINRRKVTGLSGTLLIAFSLLGDFQTFLVEESPNLIQLIGFPTLLGIFVREDQFFLLTISVLMWGLLLTYIRRKGFNHLTTLWGNGMSTPYAYPENRSLIINIWFIYTLIFSIVIALAVPLLIIANIPNR